MIRRYINLSLNIVATVAMLTAFLPMLSWSRLEGVPVPSHFDIHGAVDKVGGREILLTLALVGLGVYIVMMLALLFSFCANSTLSVAAGQTQRLSMWFIWAILALMLICIGVALFRIYRR